MNPLKHPAAHQIPENDVEKRGELKSSEVNVSANGSDTDATTSPSPEATAEHDIAPTPVLLKGKLGEWNSKVEGLSGLEARGITRVLPHEKHEGGRQGYLQMFLLWFSINMVANNIIIGLFGPLVFALGWKDSVCLSIFANALASCAPAYTSTFGPQSGNRTMVSRQEKESEKKKDLPHHCTLFPGDLPAHKAFQPLSISRLSSFADLARTFARSLVDISWAIGHPKLLPHATLSCRLGGERLDVSSPDRCSRL